MERRLVLYPQGPPTVPSRREQLAVLVHHAGGDLQRVIDGPAASLEGFARYLGRTPMLRSLRETPIVVLTRTRPFDACVVGARRTLEHAVPELEEADWLVFHDAVEHADLFDEARSLGSFDDRLDHAPIWTGPGGRRFLVLSSVSRAADLLDRVALLRDADAESPSGTRPVARVVDSEPAPRGSQRAGRR